MKLRFNIFAVAFFLPCVVFGKSLDEVSPDPRFSPKNAIMTVIEENKDLGTDLDEACRLTNRKSFRQPRLVFIAGFDSCQKAHGGQANFYRVMRAGESFYVAEEDVMIDSSDEAFIKGLNGGQKDRYVEVAKQVSLEHRRLALRSVLDALASHKKYGLSVISAGIYDESEYTEGTSFVIQVLNPTPKVVKYVWITVVGYNAVGDPVRDTVQNSSAITVKGVGPIQTDSSATYRWKYFWHTDIVESFKLKKIKVQYMDGSTRQIDNVQSIQLNEDQKRTWDGLKE